MKTVLYGRAPTSDQTIGDLAAQAKAAGFAPDEVVSEEGATAAKIAFAQREQGRRLFDMLEAGDTLVVRSVDRLGRNYRDICDTIREFMRRGVVVRTLIGGLTFDGAVRDPTQQAVRDALISFMAAQAQAQAETTKEAQRAGIAQARARQPQSYRGRKPSFDRERAAMVHDMLVAGASIGAIAVATGLSRQAIYRIRADPAWSEDRLAAWEA